MVFSAAEARGLPARGLAHPPPSLGHRPGSPPSLVQRQPSRGRVVSPTPTDGIDAESELDLEHNKGVVLAAISEKISVKFRAFCQSELMDKFLHACTGYFSAFFEVAKAEDEADALRLRNKCESRMRDVASVYAAILMRHSNYANLHQDRQFFEALYDFLTRTLFTCYERKRWHEIENELGRIFRSDHFNLAKRKNDAANKRSLLPCKQLYEQRQLASANGTTPPAPPKRQPLALGSAAAMRSPVIGAVLPTKREKVAQGAERVDTAANEPTRICLDRASAGKPHEGAARAATPPLSAVAVDTTDGPVALMASMDPQEAMETQILAAAEAFSKSVGV